jgi:hypothetical protein
MTYDFSVNFDYRCPFARNAHEHVVAALADGADYQVRFVAFSLSQAHVEEGGTPVWEDPAQRRNLIALAAGIVVRDRQPELFPAAHLSLFAARHDDGDDLREESVVKGALERAGVDPEFVFAELKAEWPFEVVRDEHEDSVKRYAAFGVPTFVSEGQAVFIRFMHRPNGDGSLARRTIDHALELVTSHRELNEFKHTTIPR